MLKKSLYLEFKETRYVSTPLALRYYIVWQGENPVIANVSKSRWGVRYTLL